MKVLIFSISPRVTGNGSNMCKQLPVAVILVHFSVLMTVDLFDNSLLILRSKLNTVLIMNNLFIFN
jgi:hypothetical protein